MRRAAILLEDALHTASIPFEGHRVLVIRSLDVGRIDVSQAPSAIALAIEARLSHVSVSALPADDPRAPGAPVVFFRDEIHPYVALAQRLASGPPPREWFWKSVLPPLMTASVSPGGATVFRRLVESVAKTSAGVLAVAAFVQELHRRDILDPVLSGFTGDDAKDLGFVFPRTDSSRTSSPTPVTAPRAESGRRGPLPEIPLGARLSARWRQTVTRWIARWGADDARSFWLAAAALAAEHAPRLGSPVFSRLAEAAVLELAPHSSAPRPATAVPTSPIPGRQGPPDSAATRASRDAGPRMRSSPPTSTPEPPPSHRPPVAEDISRRPTRSRSGGSARRDEPAAPALSDTLSPPSPARRQPDGPPATELAGLLFLVPVFERLGLAGLLASDPLFVEAAWPALLFRRVAGRLRVRGDDPILRFLDDGLDAPAATPPGSFIAPPSWHTLAVRPFVMRDDRTTDRTGRLTVALASGPWHVHLDAWIVVARRWVRRELRMGLRSLVRRPGRVAWTRTHVDVFLPLREADVRIRRAGLDVDPGWVPWLGKVITFEYR